MGKLPPKMAASRLMHGLFHGYSKRRTHRHRNPAVFATLPANVAIRMHANLPGAHRTGQVGALKVVEIDKVYPGEYPRRAGGLLEAA